MTNRKAFIKAYTKTYKDYRREQEATEWEQNRKTFSLGLGLIVMFMVAVCA